ncbi:MULTISPECIES: HD-GYP domain-containing protein [Dethiosulfovibrio]|uniref:HD-GYP domain-containing protein n=2 Tax=Dethiosulfovibrio TaxID=47054 RepID=A0ABS9EPW9_9BACT|nr:MULTISPECIES: HD-GYP domain-containing protein [Dethiosulfovibrio]MCF4114254.1 HD-GYP domain-containing protein [Dethiosulfovibrio russensis]MCF4142556.1 HD-GYP domain-containing protein [Dethiosulfovibrio marinus]
MVSMRKTIRKKALRGCIPVVVVLTIITVFMFFKLTEHLVDEREKIISQSISGYSDLAYQTYAFIETHWGMHLSALIRSVSNELDLRDYDDRRLRDVLREKISEDQYLFPYRADIRAWILHEESIVASTEKDDSPPRISSRFSSRLHLLDKDEILMDPLHLTIVTAMGNDIYLLIETAEAAIGGVSDLKTIVRGLALLPSVEEVHLIDPDDPSVIQGTGTKATWGQKAVVQRLLVDDRGGSEKSVSPNLVLSILLNFRPIFALVGLMALSMIASMVLIAWAAFAAVGRASDCMSRAIGAMTRRIDKFTVTNTQEQTEPVNTEIEEIERLSNSFDHMSRELTKSISDQNYTREKIDELYSSQMALSETLDRIISLGTELTESALKDDESFLSHLFRSAMSLVPEANAGCISVLEKDRWRFVDAVGHDLEGLNRLKLQSRYMSTEERPIVKDHPSDRFIGVPEEIADEIRRLTLPAVSSCRYTIRSDGKVVGHLALDICGNTDAKFPESTVQTLESLGQIAGMFFSMRRVYKANQDLLEQVIMVLAEFLDDYDSCTRDHSKSVANLCRKTAEVMGLSKEESTRLYWAGLLHDIGKLTIPREIIMKPGPLTEEEYEIVKTHSEAGAAAVTKSKTLSDMAEPIRYHHERWDGKGYPEGLRGANIPLLARIISVCDVYDSITDDRPYRKRLTPEEASLEMKRSAGTQLDPGLVATFLEKVAPYLDDQDTPHPLG